MDEESRIILIPRMPEDMALDLVLVTEQGLVVQASVEEIQQLQDRGVPVAELYSSGNEYASAIYGLSEEQALAALGSIQNTAIAALSSEAQEEFGLV